MKKSALYLVFLFIVSIFLTGCSTQEERIVTLERKIGGMEALENRITELE